MINIRKKSYLMGFFLCSLPLLNLSSIQAQTIAEKKAGLHRGGPNELDPQTQTLLNKVNIDLNLRKSELKDLYAQVAELHNNNAPPEAFQELLTKINAVRASIKDLDDQWLEAAVQANEGPGYALWHQPETTLEQLVIDYGSQDYVYLMSPDISAIKLSINSNIPIPRASWSEMLELILNQNGVGIKQINPYLRELYLFKQNSAPLNYITNQRQDLDMYPREARIAFLLTPDAADVRRIWFFLDKFVNSNTTAVQMVGRDVLIVGQVGDIQDLLKVYDFMAAHHNDKEFKIIPLAKVKAEDMARILGAFFDQIGEISTDGSPTSQKKPDDRINTDTNGLKIIVLSNISQALFLTGTRDEITRAEAIVRDLEQQIGGGAKEKVIYWYTTKHSNAEELAEVLEKIYRIMVQERVGVRPSPNAQAAANAEVAVEAQQAIEAVANATPRLPKELFLENFYEEGDVAINPSPVTLTPDEDRSNSINNRDNFIVDLKTGSIVMVVEQDILPKLQELLKKLDIPKKMVQIEVLMFERDLTNNIDFGLDLLRIGGLASNTNLSAMTFNNIFPVSGIPNPLNAGITEFAFSRMRTCGMPAFDLIYKFLLTQDDVQINANPSVMTINQTPAKIAIIQEFSISTGTYSFETAGAVNLKDSFTRGQYGTTMEITPTIHMNDEDDEYSDDIAYITLETTVNFDTVQNDPLNPNRPIVTRRNIHNEVLIPDGQTVILGGLRSKNSQDTKESIPFLGELPGIGLLFSDTTTSEKTTEMYIFITPTIVDDPCEDLERIKYEQMMRRPGDLPDFMVALMDARQREKDRLLAGTMRILFGQPPQVYFQTQEGCCPKSSIPVVEEELVEYDGR